MVKDNFIKYIEKEAKQYFENARPTHDWSHIERVKVLSERIGKNENADMFIVRLSVLLHDTGRKLEDETNGKLSHEEESGRIAKEILGKYNLKNYIIEEVCYSIKTHRFRKNNTPETIEAKVLYDADKLDAIGAIGIARAYSFSGENNQKLYSNNERGRNIKNEIGTGYEEDHTPVKEFLGKLLKIKDKMLTKEGKIIAEERHIFTINFFSRLENEINGEL